MNRSILILCLAALSCWAQSPAGENPAPTPTPTADDDRFPALRENADRLKAAYEKVDTDSIDEIDRLLKTRRCQINRIGGLLDRTLDAMRQWHAAEAAYWRRWAEAEQTRVDGQKKSLAGMEADQERIKELIATEAKDREELLRKKAVLEKHPKRTQEIVKEIDALILEIKDTEARLEQAQKQYDEVSIRVTNMNASITARLIEMRQHLNQTEAYGLQLSAFYEDKRKEAQEVCNTKQPNTSKTPLPKTRVPPPPPKQ